MFKYDGSKLNVITDGYFYQGIDIYGSSKRVADLNDLASYVTKNGSTTMTGMLVINSWPGLELVNVNKNNGETGLRVRSLDSSGNNNIKAYFGWLSSMGSYQYNAACGKYLGIKDDGTPHYHGNTLTYRKLYFICL